MNPLLSSQILWWGTEAISNFGMYRDASMSVTLPWHIWPDQKHTWHAYSRFIVTEFALYWFMMDLVHCGHINRWNINWNSLRQFGHSWIFCWALAKTSSFFCWGCDNNWWSSVITGNIERQRVWHDIKRALFSCYLVSRYRVRSWDQWISVALLKFCSQTSVLKYQCLAIYYMTNIISLFLCNNRFHGIWCIGSLKHAFASNSLEILCFILKEKHLC